MKINKNEKEEFYNNKKKECNNDINGNNEQCSTQKFMKDQLFDLAKDGGLMEN